MIQKSISYGILHYKTPEGDLHNPHRPAVIAAHTDDFAYYNNGKHQNIVGISQLFNGVIQYTINNVQIGYYD